MYEPTRYFLLSSPCDAEVVANVELRRSGFNRDHHLENAAIGGTFIVATHQEDHGVIGVGIGRHGVLPLAKKEPTQLAGEFFHRQTGSFSDFGHKLLFELGNVTVSRSRLCFSQGAPPVSNGSHEILAFDLE